MPGAWSIVRHPAFWIPILLALGVDFYFYLSHLDINAIHSDGWGYYLHLPAIFVQGDPGLSFLNRPNLPRDIAQYRFADGRWQGLSVHGDGYLDKYAFGPAVLQLPFFLAALVVAHFRYSSVNGFERTFQIANALSGAFFMGLGSFLVYRALRKRYCVLPSTLALGTIILATNLLQYASVDGSYSHVYGYCLLAGLVYLTVQRTESPESPSLPAFILFGFLIGLAVIVRPTNFTYALLFLVFIRGAPLRRIMIGTACALLASAVAASPQMALWYATTGKLIYYSYVGEGFNFGSPELFNYLFSIRKGVFFWHPVYLLMVGALVSQIPRRPFEGTITLFIVLLGLYIGSSWGDFTFGDSFGSRQSIELLPALALPWAGAIACLLSRRWRLAAAAPAVALIALNLILFRGYLNDTLPHNNTNKTTYAQFWLRKLAIFTLK